MSVVISSISQSIINESNNLQLYDKSTASVWYLTKTFAVESVQVQVIALISDIGRGIQ